MTRRNAARPRDAPRGDSIPPHAVENPHRKIGGDPGRGCRDGFVGTGLGTEPISRREGGLCVVEAPLPHPAAVRGGRKTVVRMEVAIAAGPTGRRVRRCRALAASRGRRRGMATVDGGDARCQGCGDGGGFVAAATGAGIACTRGQEEGRGQRRGEGRPAGRGGDEEGRPPTVGRSGAHPAPTSSRGSTMSVHRRLRTVPESLAGRAGQGGRFDPAPSRGRHFSRLRWASRRPRGRPGDVRRNNTGRVRGWFAARAFFGRIRRGRGVGHSPRPAPSAR